MKIFEHAEVDLKYGDLVCETLPTGRTYTTPEGKKYPSITTVLGILGEDDIREWRQRVGEKEANAIGRRAAGRGTAVHSFSEKFLKNQPIDDSKMMPHVKHAFESIKPILTERVGKIFLQERALYSDHLGVAGRVDLIAEFDGIRSIIDIKTSNRVKTKEDIHSYFMQESGYAVMFEERTGLPVSRLVTIMTVDYSNPIVFIEKRDRWVGKLQETIAEYRRRRLFGHV